MDTPRQPDFSSSGLRFNATFVNNFRWIGPGRGNNFLSHQTFHVTVNANGVTTVVCGHRQRGVQVGAKAPARRVRVIRGLKPRLGAGWAPRSPSPDRERGPGGEEHGARGRG